MAAVGRTSSRTRFLLQQKPFSCVCAPRLRLCLPMLLPVSDIDQSRLSRTRTEMQAGDGAVKGKDTSHEHVAHAVDKFSAKVLLQ